MPIFILLLVLFALFHLNYALMTDLYFANDDIITLPYIANQSYLALVTNYFQSGELIVPRGGIGYLLGYLNFKFLFDHFGLNPLPFILNNHLLHTLNLILLFMVLAKLTRNNFVAFLTALIFNKFYLFYFSNLHDYLGVFFSLSAIFLFLKYPQKIYLSLAMFVLALISKQNTIFLPLFLVSLSYFYERNLVAKTKPFLVIFLIYLFFQVLYFIRSLGTPINFSYETDFSVQNIYKNFPFYYDWRVIFAFLLIPFLSGQFRTWPILAISLLTLLPALILKNRQDLYYLYLPSLYLVIYIALNFPKTLWKIIPSFLILVLLFGGREVLPVIARQKYPNWQKVSIQNLKSKVERGLKMSPQDTSIDLGQINLERDARTILEYNVLPLFLDKELGEKYQFTYDPKTETLQARRI